MEIASSRPFCFQTHSPLGFAVQLKLTPELKQALIEAQANGKPLALRFREEPHKEVSLATSACARPEALCDPGCFTNTVSQAGSASWRVRCAPRAPNATPPPTEAHLLPSPPHTQAVLCVGTTEYLFGTTPTSQQQEVMEMTPRSKGACAVASVKQRLTLQVGLGGMRMWMGRVGGR